eukprot:m.76812 g.76812  ORF g.76812 m.76812 type:complete len:2981 (+) comp10556_c0_seq1:218-9160(+)
MKPHAAPAEVSAQDELPQKVEHKAHDRRQRRIPVAAPTLGRFPPPTQPAESRASLLAWATAVCDSTQTGDQCDESATQFARLLCHFFAESGDSDLAAAATLLNNSLDAGTFVEVYSDDETTDTDDDVTWRLDLVKFYPKYGCVLVGVTSFGSHSVPTTRLRLLAPDEWAYAASVPHVGSAPRTDVQFIAGEVPRSALDEFLEKVRKGFDEAQKKTGTQRTAATGQQGHQKTPTFILALVHDAVSALTDKKGAPHLPHGGMTDVGQHTGGKARSTAWPLAAALARFTLESLVQDAPSTASPAGTSAKGASAKDAHDGAQRQPSQSDCQTPVTFVAALADWELWLLERLLATPGDWSTASISTPAMLLQSVCRRGEALAHNGYDVEAFTERSQQARDRINECFARALAQVADSFAQLPLSTAEDGRINDQRPRLPQLAPQSEWDFGENACSREQYQKLAIKNLSPHPVAPDPAETSLEQFLKWVENTDGWQYGPGGIVAPVPPYRRVAAIEEWVFTAVRELSLSNGATFTSETAEEEISDLETLLEFYADMATASPHGRLPVVTQSTRTLTAWAIACLMDARACVLYKKLPEYDMGLDFADLRHLSLTDGLAHDALRVVTLYLRGRTHDGKLPRPIFTFRGNDVTAMFAAAVTQDTPDLLQIWKYESDRMAEREKKHWKMVIEKKNEVKQLNRELTAAQSSASSADMRHRQHCDSYEEYEELREEYYRWQVKEQRLRAERNEKQAKVDRLQYQLECARKPPPPVIQPFPKNKPSGLAVVFFLHMPEPLHALANATLQAQATLRNGVNGGIKETEAGSVRWTNHFTSHDSAFTAHRGDFSSAVKRALKVELHANFKVPSTIGPRVVTEISSETQGVWHPPDDLKLYWPSGDPYVLIDKIEMCTAYTSKFVHDASTSGRVDQTLAKKLDEQLGWTLIVHDRADTDPCRGNRGVAWQDRKPDWLTRSQYLSFCNLRAYPRLQLRRIAAALHERSLPFGRPEVQLLLRQALFHVGSLRVVGLLEGDPPPAMLEWKHEDLVVDGGEGLSALVVGVCDLASDLRARISEHSALLAVIDVAIYLGAFHPELPALEVVRRDCVTTVDEWIGIRESQATESDPLDVPRLRADQCVFAMYGVLAHGGTNRLSSRAMTDLCRLLVQAQAGQPFAVNAAKPGAFKTLWKRCEEVAVVRLRELKAAVLADNTIATAAVKTVLAGMPKALCWTCLCENRDSVEAWDDEESVLYSLNLATGAVLQNGTPPSSLPKPVLMHALYQRVFGERDFEVRSGRSGEYITKRYLDDCTYTFVYDDGDLCVTELHRCDVDSSGLTGTTESPLELLPVENDDNLEWADDLPVRIRSLHSHWLHRKSGSVLVRSKCLPDRRTFFVILPDGEEEEGRGLCFRVPVQRQLESGDELIAAAEQGDLVDMLQLWDNLPVPALTKFEKLEFIHCYHNAAAGEYRFELPRYRLEFILDSSTNGRLRSANFVGYQLQSPPHLPDTLAGFTSYLVLEPAEGPASASQMLKVVIPVGDVTISPVTDSVEIVGGDDCGQHRGYAVYDVHHRFGELRAAATADRLQLAAVYAAASVTGVNDPRAGMPGKELAVSLLRQSFVNRPLTARELAALRDTQRLAGDVPAIVLLCEHLRASAAQSAFLHPDLVPDDEGQNEDAASFDPEGDHATAYVLAKGRGHVNPRILLTSAEERRVLGCVATRPKAAGATALLRSVGPIVNVQPLKEVPVNFVKDVERALCRLVTPADRKTPEPFPLERANADDTLAEEMLQELEDSWNTNERLPEVTVRNVQEVRDEVEEWLTTTVLHREVVEQHTLSSIARLPSAADRPDLKRLAAIEKLRRTSGVTPTPTLPELMRTLWEADGVELYNPFLHSSDADTAALDGLIKQWMALCVLEDRLRRLLAQCIATPAKSELAAELELCRTWDTDRNPQWLAFEVDGGIQVRPAQYALAQTALTTPGAVMQLNMGLGKTRVIVPLLLLHSRFGPVPVRLNLLPALLPEAHEYFHRILTGSSVFQLPLFVFPFHRDVEVTADRGRCMLEQLAHCHAVGGAILAAPEGRASLHLKQHELRLDNKTDEAELLAQFESTPCCDIVDESDELLRVKFQLIYAVGQREALPSHDSRCVAVRVVLDALLHSPECHTLLKRAGTGSVEDPATRGQFYNELRLFPTAMATVAPELTRAIAKHVLSRAGAHKQLRWLESFGQPDKVVDFLCNGDSDANDVISLANLPSEACQATLLALRGLLAHGVLWNALEKRYRVDYGITAPTHPRRKRLAVPFRAADTPADRAEFAHPDSALLLTTLSYAYGGLTDDEVLEAFEILADLTPTVQENQYKAWFAASAKDVLNERDQGSIRTEMNIDLTNVLQKRLLCKTYNKCLPLIHFWLETAVFPTETVQYAQRLKATAWHLGPKPGGTCAGFSGTNDQHRLLPSFVQQVPLNNEGLRATNGHMLDMLRKRARYQALPTAHLDGCSGGLTPVAERLLDFAVGEKAVAVIDSGALLAGVELIKAANHLLSKNEVKNVVFFNRGSPSGRGEWVVRTDQGEEWPLKQAPILERDAFVIFDEEHCRGSDMKLKPDALAVLTLGPRMAKDKLMQAAGRLRKLQTQKLLVTALPDVHSQLVAEMKKVQDEPGVMEILQWVMNNTIEASRSGLHEWAINGAHYCSTADDGDAALQAEVLDLATFYNSRTTPRLLSELILSKLPSQEWRESARPDLAACVTKLEQAAQQYGTGCTVHISALDEECEREVEQEKELEREVEIQLPRQDPRKEVERWDYLQRGVPLGERLTSTEMLGQYADRFKAILWPRDVLVTSNFFETVQARPFANYQRGVDAMTILRNGDVLLLSDREADQFLEAEWDKQWETAASGNPPRPSALLHKAFVCCPRDSHAKMHGVHHHPSLLSPSQLACVQLFNGDVAFPEETETALKTLLQDREACDAAQLFPELHTRKQYIKESDLEKICDGDARGLPKAQKLIF